MDNADIEAKVVRELTDFQRNILVVLAQGPTYGLDIKSELEDYYGADVNHGRLYPNLDELVELGLVEKGQLDKRTNEYKLTEAGFAAILDHLAFTFSHASGTEERARAIEDLVTAHS